MVQMTSEKSTKVLSPRLSVSRGLPSDHVRSASRSWKEIVSESYGGLAVAEPNPDSGIGSLAVRNLDKLRVVELSGTPQTFRRTPALISKKPIQTLTLSLIVNGTSRLVQDGRDCLVVPGDFCILESTRPYSFEFLETTKMIDFVWSRPVVRISDEEARHLTAISLRDATPLAPWLATALQQLTSFQQDLSPGGAIGLAHGTAELVATVVREALSSPSDAGARARYEEMLRFIDCNLSDPDFGVDRISEEFFVSVRTVNRLFARFGVPVASTIRDRRLEACRRMMLSRAHADQSIGWIITQCGISSPQVFSRMFAAKFGQAPSVYRQLHGVTSGEA